MATIRDRTGGLFRSSGPLGLMIWPTQASTTSLGSSLAAAARNPAAAWYRRAGIVPAAVSGPTCRKAYVSRAARSCPNSRR